MTFQNDFDEIYSAHAAEVYYHCLRAVSLPEVAERLTSDVFAALHSEPPDVVDEHLKSLLALTARQLASEYWEQQSPESIWSQITQETSSKEVMPPLSLESLLERSSRLKQVHRVCFLLRFRHDMSRSEIATLTGLSQLEVKGHLQQAVRLLQGDAALANSLDPEALLAAQAQPGCCPSPRLLFAAKENVLPSAVGTAVREHESRCPLCLILLEGLAPASGELTPIQDARIHERLMRFLQPEELPVELVFGRRGMWRMMGPVSVIVLMALGSVTSYRLIHGSLPKPVLPEPASASAFAATGQDFPELHTVAPLEPAQELGASRDSALGPAGWDLETALTAYRQGNFAGAETALSPLVTRYPEAEAPLLYLGVSQLQLGENTAANVSLTRALAIGKPARHADVSWYLAVADLRVGKNASAMQKLQELCSTDSIYAARACALAAQIGTSRR